MVNGLPAPKRIFKRGEKLEINPLLLQAFGITAEDIAETIRMAEEPEAMRDMFAFLSDYATLSDPRTRLLISGDKLDFLVADLKRRMAIVAGEYGLQAEEYAGFYEEQEPQLLKIAKKAREFSKFKGVSRLDKIAFIDAIAQFEHTSGSIIPMAFEISDYGREDYWPRKLLAFLRTHGMPGMVKEGMIREATAPDTKIRWNLNVRQGKIMYMAPEEYMERVNIFNRIGMSRTIEAERRASEKGYRGIGYYPPLSESSYRSILEGIKAGNEIDIPNLVYEKGMLENQEGFHRALVARDLGAEKIPVQVIGDMPAVFIRVLNLIWNSNLTEQAKAINSLKGKIIGGIQMIRESVAPAPAGNQNGNKEFRANPNLINKQAARIAHAGTSFEPEKRGEQAISSFAEEVQSIYERLKPYARTDAEKALLLSEMERFQTAYAQKFNDLLYSHSRIYSTMIAGPSNFPVERMRKINDAYDKKAEETRDWVKRAERAMLRALKGLATEEAGGEVAVLKQKIVDAERNHEFMVKTNVIVRKNIPDEQKIREIMALAPISEATAREVLKPDYMGRVGFPAYALSNDTANIRRMKEHLAELEKREATPTGEITFAGGSIVDNREADRVQIFFDQKPPQDMINKLRSEGWHWSPHIGAWMRKRTQAAMYSASRITGAVLPATPAPALPVPSPPINTVQSLARLRAAEWFKAQVSNPYERFYLYYRIGDFRVSNVDMSGYTLASAERIPVSWTAEQAVQWMINAVQRLPILPLDAVPVPAPVFAPAPAAVAPPTTPPVRAIPRITVPQPQEVPELRWVYGTRDGKWHLVGPEDRDYAHGITQERMKLIGPEVAKTEYLSPALARAAPPPSIPAPINVPWPTEKPTQKKFVQKTFEIGERMRRGYGYGGYRGRGYA